MKPYSEAEILRDMRKEIKDLQTLIAEKRILLDEKLEECTKMQEQMHERKVQIEEIRQRIREQGKKQSRISDSYKKHKENYEKLLKEKTSQDEKSAAEAIANLIPENIEKRSYTKPGKHFFQALQAVMIMLQKPTDWESISKEMKTPNLFV